MLACFAISAGVIFLSPWQPTQVAGAGRIV